MISIIAISVGIIGMFGSWAFAWWLWKHSIPPLSRAAHRRPIWQNEPTPKPRILIPPPNWLFTNAPEHDGAAPVARQHPSSNANTSFFNREELERARPIEEGTEILAEDALVFEAPPWEPPPNDTREPTWLIGGRRPGKET